MFDIPLPRISHWDRLCPLTVSVETVYRSQRQCSDNTMLALVVIRSKLENSWY